MKKKILLVEDEPTIRKLLQFILSKEFDVKSTVNGYEAFLRLENRDIPDLIILDWIMPQMDGNVFLKCLKVSGLYSEIPVIVLSASENIQEELNRLPYTVNCCLSKPFDPLKLKEVIGDVLNNFPTYGFVNRN